jgi:TonB-linked SusC/RagA family outer membrane protein
MISLPKLKMIASSIVCMLLLCNLAHAQAPIVVKGVIQDSKDLSPLAGAVIQQEGGSLKTATNDKGTFEIKVPATSKLVVTMVGYNAVVVNAAANVVVKLEAHAGNLEDVVVIGYGSQKKELLTGSVAQVKIKQADIEVPTTNMGNLLAGKMAGVNVSTPNGLPGSQPTITIRTASSWNTAPVLYVIDGKIAGAGDFNNLSPNEVDNVTVLKDAATTAAYGSRAGGGVILVTTKRGTSGKAQVQYSFNTGRDVRGKNMDLTSAVEWGNIYARIWGYGVPGPAGCPWTPADSTYFATHNFGGAGDGYGFNLLKDVYRNPVTTTHNLSVSGGTDKIKYFVGGSYVDQQSFLNGLEFKKYNLRANITADITRDFSLFAGVSLNDNWSYGPSSNSGAVDGDMYTKLLVWQPYMPSFTTSGKPVDYFWITNKSAEANGAAGYSHSENIKPVANISLTYKMPFLKGMSAKVTFNKSYTSYQNKIFTQPFKMYQVKQYTPVQWGINDSDIVSVRNSSQAPSLEQYGSWSQDKQLDLQLNYTRSFGQHHVNANLVYESWESRGNGVDAWINGFPLYTTDQWWAATSASIVNNTATKGVSNSYGTESVDGRRSWVGQFMYDYAGKYMANFTYRYDGSMKFAPDHRWGFFPGGSVGWIVSKENFFKSNVIDMLKVRASAGLTGFDGVGGYQWQATYKGGSSAFFGNPGVSLNPGLQYGGVVNPDITWEKYLNKNFAVDINFLKHFNATVEYWHTLTYDILANRINTTPPTFSLPLPAVNYGKEKAEGFDFSLGYNSRIGQVNFNSSVVASYGYAWYTEKDQNPTYDYQNQIGPGRYTSMVTGYVVDHMIRTQADLDAWNKEHPGYKFNGIAAQVGQFVYKDLGSAKGMGVGDTAINGYDIAVLRGRNEPVVVGLNLAADWKGFSIMANFNGSFGQLKSFNDVSGGVEWNRMWKPWYDQSWTPTNTNAWLPKRLSANDGNRSQYTSGSNFWLANASFLRLKFLNLAYTIPPTLYHKYLQSVRLYVSGSNLFVISKFNKKFYDPEMGSGTSFPIVKSYNAGISVTF